ncbi:MAG TPA: transposase zinc-binding domain-containing protein [Thermoanaerobaculia bacterium]|nr:transposase zinc-binding domain-containing protein [Thermoanaerobaculia bacterium]
MGALCPAVYQPRRPKSSPLYRLVGDCYDEVKGTWEERFEATYGRWRSFVDDVVFAFTDCGDLNQGFARVYCDACCNEYLLAFSCSRRGFCPSCAAKRRAIFGAFLREEVLADVSHCMWTLTIPKLLRPFFLHHRELLGPLSRAGWETVAES